MLYSNGTETRKKEGMSVALKKIEQDGYIERTLGSDARYNELKITEKGISLPSGNTTIWKSDNG